MTKALIAEFIGTFTLSLTVLLSVSHQFAIPTPILAGVVLGLFVYTIGPISGCHINPGVTIGLWSIKKIGNDKAMRYLIVQLLAGAAAFLLVMLLGMSVPTIANSSTNALLFELVGMTVFTFGIGAVVLANISDTLAGFVIGGSLFLGISIAALGGSAGILNPAVGVSLGVVAIGYYIVEIVGGVAGFQLYAYFVKPERRRN